ncbi:MAG: hypothetical protein IPN29_17835 [Saprospiraceae bacterium]|nr:hypothetical protein [Saprospiraceae bacterium]
MQGFLVIFLSLAIAGKSAIEALVFKTQIALIEDNNEHEEEIQGKDMSKELKYLKKNLPFLLSQQVPDFKVDNFYTSTLSNLFKGSILLVPPNMVGMA